MTMLLGSTQAEPSKEPISAAACLFHGFSDPARLIILPHLLLGEHRVVELTEHLGLAQSTVSKHLSCLRDCGLVTSRPQGRASMFSVTHPEATVALLTAAEQLLESTGFAVTLCINHGVAALRVPTSTPEDGEVPLT
jgi:DNA-binding transcriptional ArsR family regulator